MRKNLLDDNEKSTLWGGKIQLIDDEEKSNWWGEKPTWSGGKMMYMQFPHWSAALLWSPLNIFVNNRILIAVQRRSVKARLCIQSSALSLLQWSLHRHLYLQRHHLSSLSSSSYYLQRHLFCHYQPLEKEYQHPLQGLASDFLTM